MPVIAANFCCLLCGHQLSVKDIARAHFLKHCPACKAAIEVHAPGALTRSNTATAAGLVGMVLGLGGCVAALTVLGINEAVLNAWPSTWQAGLAVAVLVAGSLLAYLFQRVQVYTTLAAMRTRLKAEGLLQEDPRHKA